MSYTYTKSCEYCRRSFTAKRKEAKYCSDGCRVSAYKKRKGLWIPDFKQMASMQRRLPSANEHKLIAVGQQIEVLRRELESLEKKFNKSREEFEQYNNWAKTEYGTMWRDNAKKKADEMDLISDEIGKKVTLIKKQEVIAQKLNTEIEIEQLRTNKKTYTSEDIKAIEFEQLDFTGEWYNTFGRPARGFMMILYGTPFGGKTTYSLKFAQYLSMFGSVLFITAEEGIVATFQSKVKSCGANSIVYSEERFKQAILKDAKKFDFVVIDSISKIGLDAEELDDWHIKNEKCSIIGILQSRRDGDYKGSAEYTHNADIVVKVSREKIEVEKNRYMIF